MGRRPLPSINQPLGSTPALQNNIKTQPKTRVGQAGRESWLPFDGEMQIKLNNKKKRQRSNTENRSGTEQTAGVGGRGTGTDWDTSRLQRGQVRDRTPGHTPKPLPQDLPILEI